MAAAPALLPLAELALNGSFIHGVGALFVTLYLGMLARSRGRRFIWGLLGLLFWAASALLFWSLSGADMTFMGVLGGVCGAIPAYVIVLALDIEAPKDGRPLAAGALEAPAALTSTAAPLAAERLCPHCKTPGQLRGELYLCGDPSCNSEFFEFEAVRR